MANDSVPGPRLPPLTSEELGDEGHAIVSELRAGVSLPPGDIPELMATFLRHPGLVRPHSKLGLALFQGALPVRDRELAILRTSWLCHCALEWSEHVALGKALAGLTSDDMERIIDGSGADGWDEHSRALLCAVEEMHFQGRMGDKAWDILARTYSDQQLIELPILIGQYHGLAYLVNSCRIRLPSGSAGLDAR